MRRKIKPDKIICEICENNNKEVLHLHHCVERTELHTDNSWYNLACICSNCHNLVHYGSLNIIGIYPSTKLPYGRTVIYKLNGESNIDGIDKPYYNPKPKSVKWHNGEEE